jgi:hypothetical protein
MIQSDINILSMRVDDELKELLLVRQLSAFRVHHSDREQPMRWPS